MKHALLSLGLLIAGGASAAPDTWKTILRVDPYLANGYFIVDQASWNRMGIDHIAVDIAVVTPQGSGAPTKAVVQSFSITNGFFGKADLGFLSTLSPGQRAGYHLRAYDALGQVVVNVDPEAFGEPGPIWEPACVQGCIANTYSWALHASYCNELGQAYIELRPAINPDGSQPYFFIPEYRWGQFTNQYTPSNFNLPYGGWPEATGDNHNLSCVISVPITSEMRDEQGFTLIPGGMAYGIVKYCGPWDYALSGQGTDHVAMSSTNLCPDLQNANDNLRLLFNGNAHVQQLMAYNGGTPPLECHPMFPFGSADDVNQWGGVFAECTALTVYSDEYPDGTVDILGWTLELVDCAVSVTSERPYDFGFGLSVSVDEVTPDGAKPVVAVALPFGKDPKLVSMPKTPLQPGLYEFTVVMRNGDVLRHFEQFTAPVVLNSHFAAFANANIYPVPVKGNEFAVEFNLAYPLQINILITDNEGHQYLNKQVDFDTAGLNKFVVNTNNSWHPGLYHAVFQFQDGSASSKSFTIAE
ncbi:MAG: hypothetical protein JSS84_12115 [Bacteroidetes bacterium]|nr:hypothetical protein [Bacteroidota bacterium]